MGDIQRRLLTASLTAVLALAPFMAQPVRAASDAVDDAYPIPEDTPLVVPSDTLLGLLDNDTTDAGPLCVTGFNTAELEGSLDASGATDGSFTYTPPANFHGTTTFRYDVAAEAAGACPIGTAEDSATVTITVTAVNDPPTAVADFFAALKDRTLNVAAPGVLGNDSDIDGDSLSAIKVNNPAHGALTLAADGGFSYTPSNNYTGPDAFSYRASDGEATSAVRVVSLTVSAIPPTPTPTPAPTPTPTPTASPEPSPSESPFPSDSGLPSPSPSETGLAGSPSPEPTPSAGPVAGEGGLPIFAIGALALLVLLLGVAGFYFVQSQRAGGDGDYASASDTEADDRYDDDPDDGGDAADSDGGDGDDSGDD